MAAMSDWLERVLASHIFGSGTFSKPSVLAFALCSGEPLDSHTGTTIPELPNTGGYTRKTLNPSQTNWEDPIGVDGIISNLVEVLFDEASSDWGWASGVAILDNATYGAGNVLIHASLTTPKLIGDGDQFRLKAGDIDLTFA